MDNIDYLSSRIASGLAELRKSRKVTQEELAERLGTKQEAISRIERGAAVPSWDFINRIAKTLNAEVDISFKSLSSEETSALSHSSTGKEYICVNCLYRWESRLNRAVIQCPQCHKRQGVLFLEYTRALKAFQDIQLQVKKSPPFRKLPPVRSLRKNTPQMLKLILKTAGKTFPSPRLPVSLLFRILEQSSQKPVENPPTAVKKKVLLTEKNNPV
jgi:transcriptional regulator with XRE-family HTH domain